MLYKVRIHFAEPFLFRLIQLFVILEHHLQRYIIVWFHPTIFTYFTHPRSCFNKNIPQFFFARHFKIIFRFVSNQEQMCQLERNHRRNKCATSKQIVPVFQLEIRRHGMVLHGMEGEGRKLLHDTRLLRTRIRIGVL